jgi:hypothetical protein
MPHGIDAAMHPMQPAVLDPSAYRLPAQPERGELLHAHDSVLASRDLGKWGSFVTHTVT